MDGRKEGGIKGRDLQCLRRQHQGRCIHGRSSLLRTELRDGIKDGIMDVVLRTDGRKEKNKRKWEGMTESRKDLRKEGIKREVKTLHRFRLWLLV
jgi:hypothetical protein